MTHSTLSSYGRSDIAWLRDPVYDLSLIFGTAFLAILAGVVVLQDGNLFGLVLAANLWLLGYHHVVSTFTRLVFDRESFAQNKFLIVYLPFVVAAAVIMMVAFQGLWLVPTIYLHWQLYHYARQSEGIAKAYARKSGHGERLHSSLSRFVFYLIPIAGFSVISSRGYESFLVMPIKMLPVPWWLSMVVCGIAIVALALWVVDQLRAWREGKSGLLYLAYMFTHFLVFYLAYIFMPVLEFGWLIVNIWHNAQYILFVWMFNNKKYSDGKTQKSFIGYMSQDGKLWLYLGVCVLISTAVYYSLDSYVATWISSTFMITTAAVGIVIYQTINFHHYIVDSLIWKLRKPAISKTLELG